MLFPTGCALHHTLFPLLTAQPPRGSGATRGRATGTEPRPPGVPVMTVGSPLRKTDASSFSTAVVRGLFAAAAEADRPPPPSPDATAGRSCPGKAQPPSPRAGSEGNGQTDSMGWDLQPAGPGVPTTRATGVTSTRPGLPIPAKSPQPWNSRPVQAHFPDGREGSVDILRELRAGILGAGETHLPKL